MSRFTRLREFLPFTEALGMYYKLKRGQYKNLRVSKLKHPFSMRKNPYDWATFTEVILKEAYNIPVDFSPRYIIDGGGNIGLTAAYFASKYPQATIVSFEPDRENFGLLEQNVSDYKNVEAINGGVWYRPASLLIKDTGLGDNAFMVEETGETSSGTIKAWSIDGVMQQMNWPHIDILKLDVEGSEKEIFSHNYESWLPKTRLLIVELHDRMKAGCSKAVFSALTRYNFSFSVAGENLVFKNEEAGLADS